MLAAIFVTGSPPFSLFFSEMMILRAGFLGARPVATAVFLGRGLVILFCGFRISDGPPRAWRHLRQPISAMPPDRDARLGHDGDALVAALVAVVSTFYLPGPLMALIRAAVSVVAGGVDQVQSRRRLPAH